MGLSAGLLDTEIVLQYATKTQDAGTGEEVIDWTTLTSTVWAAWKPLKGAERFLAQQQLSAQIEGSFVIYDPAIRPTAGTTRVVYAGETYDIQAVIDLGREEGLELSVVARVD